jgi:hypothetical protein
MKQGVMCSRMFLTTQSFDKCMQEQQGWNN